jgi:hypothetical protein
MAFLLADPPSTGSFDCAEAQKTEERGQDPTMRCRTIDNDIIHPPDLLPYVHWKCSRNVPKEKANDHAVYT